MYRDPLLCLNRPCPQHVHGPVSKVLLKEIKKPSSPLTRTACAAYM